MTETRLHPDPETETVTIGQAVAIPPGTAGYITAASEGYAIRGLRPLRTAGQPMGTIRKNNSRLMNNGRSERITLIEASRFQSFPDAFAWTGSWRRSLGNAVPPLLMRTIAGHILTAILKVAA